MAADISERVRAIADARDCAESEVFERALERGVDDLWRDLTLAQYFDGDIERTEAIDRLDRATVERADRERAVVEDDVAWGLDA